MLLDDTIQKLILSAPVHAPFLVGLPAEKMTALLLRVDSVKTFRSKTLKFQVAFTGYEHEGVYLACIPFRVFDRPISSLTGDGYLNPRQEADRKALQYLTIQECLPFVFLSFDLKSQVTHSVPWQEKSREAAVKLLERSGSTGLIDRSFDPIFQRLKGRFQALYSSKDLLPSVDAGA